MFLRWTLLSNIIPIGYSLNRKCVSNRSLGILQYSTAICDTQQTNRRPSLTLQSNVYSVKMLNLFWTPLYVTCIKLTIPNCHNQYVIFFCIFKLRISIISLNGLRTLSLNSRLMGNYFQLSTVTIKMFYCFLKFVSFRRDWLLTAHKLIWFNVL